VLPDAEREAYEALLAAALRLTPEVTTCR